MTTGVYVALLRDLDHRGQELVGTTAVLAGELAAGSGVGRSAGAKKSSSRPVSRSRPAGKRLDEMIVALRTLLAGGWVEFHVASTTTSRNARIEPAPTGAGP